ncbi:MAG TPA: L-rhamnose isomerase [Verrucomicrobiae bacterium]|nr:L-rhamnose isomerase [Verrucomicrobiae bacterium]
MKTNLYTHAARVTEKNLVDAYLRAKEVYAALDVDADAAIATALAVPISLHCWQADDVAGLESGSGAVDSGGIKATGNYPGRARNGDEIRQDLAKAMELLPGVQRVNLHAFYAETNGRKVDRDAIEPKHFARWIAWAKEQKIGLDFNPTWFAHPKAADGLTLSHPDKAIREFWIAHGIACRKIAAHMAREQHTPCVINHWIPDGVKDSPVDRWSPRARLVKSLDAILATKLAGCVDCVEGKLFGIGSEDYVVGSHEFYSHYALTRGVVLCLDMGHFHPTETIADKISALLQFHKKLLLHVSRPVRWDSDHVVVFNDDVRAVFQELVRGGALDRAIVATDYFDASINRVAAYVIGARATRKAVLAALIEPIAALRQLETAGQGAQKLALLEETKMSPLDAVWNELCRRADTPVFTAWIAEIEEYEAHVLSKR